MTTSSNVNVEQGRANDEWPVASFAIVRVRRTWRARCSCGRDMSAGSHWALMLVVTDHLDEAHA